MTRLQVVTRDTLSAIMGLKVRDDQSGFVADNTRTLAQVAYDQPGAHVWGVWEDETPVGLLAVIDPRTYPWLEEGDDPDASFIWRLMIDRDHQHKGHGGRVLDLARARTRDWGLPRIVVTAMPGAGSPIPFYERHGFVRTGRIVDDEIELARDA